MTEASFFSSFLRIGHTGNREGEALGVVATRNPPDENAITGLRKR
jgi:hypothetical protein